MRRTDRANSGSMDLLLDTMCNTFGGVCFVALMVTLISASAPKAANEEADLARETERRIVERERSQLLRRRDELKTAIEIQENFIRQNSTGVVMKADLRKLAASVGESESEIRRYEKKRVEYLDELAKLKTTDAYNKREAARLARLLRDLEDKTGRPLFDRHRTIRTPRERRIEGLTHIDVWLHSGRLYFIDDSRDVRHDPVTDDTWDVHLVSGGGRRLSEDFFQNGVGKEWIALQGRFNERSLVRIFTDTVSFPELCLLRDAVISRKSLYNWIIAEGDVIHFKKGYDGHVE